MKAAIFTILALSGADVHLPNGDLLKDATVLIQKDRIVAVGTNIELPDNAKTIDVSGKTITARSH